MNPEQPPCTATTRAGRPCRGQPVPGSRPLRCYVHGGRRPAIQVQPDPTGLPWLSPEPDYPPNTSLQEQIGAVQLVTRQVLQRLQQEMDPAEYRRLASLVFTGANTVARLLRAQQELAGEAADGFAAVAQALDMLGQEIGQEL